MKSTHGGVSVLKSWSIFKGSFCGSDPQPASPPNPPALCPLCAQPPPAAQAQTPPISSHLCRSSLGSTCSAPLPPPRSEPPPGLPVTATFLLGPHGPRATRPPGSLWERGSGRALLRAVRWLLVCPEDSQSGQWPARPPPLRPRPPHRVLRVLERASTCAPGASALPSLGPGFLVTHFLQPSAQMSPLARIFRPSRARSSVPWPPRTPPSLLPSSSRLMLRAPATPARFCPRPSGRASRLSRALPTPPGLALGAAGSGPCLLGPGTAWAAGSRFPLPWGHAPSFSGFVLFKNDSWVIVTDSPMAATVSL